MPALATVSRRAACYTFKRVFIKRDGPARLRGVVNFALTAPHGPTGTQIAANIGLNVRIEFVLGAAGRDQAEVFTVEVGDLQAVAAPMASLS